MLVKVKYFEDFDHRSDINQPLSAVATFTSAYKFVNGTKQYMFATDDIEVAKSTYPDLDFTAFTDLTQNVFVVADLATYESLDLIDVEFTDMHATVSRSVVGSTQILTITAEDTLTAVTIRLIKNDIGIAQTYPMLYVCTSLTDQYTSDEFETACRMHAPILTTVDTTSLYVGAIELPASYVSVDSAAVNIAALTFNATYDTLTYISADGTDPDNDILLNDSDAMLFVNSAPFTVDETLILDSNFVYLKFDRNSEIRYYKLIKHSTYSRTAVIDAIKQKYSDSYVCLFLNSVLISTSNITTEQRITIELLKTESDIISYCNSNQIDYTILSDYTYSDLIDVDATAELNDITKYATFNQLFETTSDYGFAESDIENFGKVIAKMLYDVVSQIQVNSVLTYPIATQYLSYLSETTVIPSYLQTSTQLLVSSETKTGYLAEIANSAFMLDNFTTRHFDWISSRLDYALNQIKLHRIVYDATETDIANMSIAIKNLKSIANATTLASPAYQESFIHLFFDKLYYLKLNSDVVQRISFA
jgi:hypothetical protein